MAFSWLSLSSLKGLFETSPLKAIIKRQMTMEHFNKRPLPPIVLVFTFGKGGTFFTSCGTKASAVVGGGHTLEKPLNT